MKNTFLPARWVSAIALAVASGTAAVAPLWVDNELRLQILRRAGQGARGRRMRSRCWPRCAAAPIDLRRAGDASGGGRASRSSSRRWPAFACGAHPSELTLCAWPWSTPPAAIAAPNSSSSARSRLTPQTPSSRSPTSFRSRCAALSREPRRADRRSSASLARCVRASRRPPAGRPASEAAPVAAPVQCQPPARAASQATMGGPANWPSAEHCCIQPTVVETVFFARRATRIASEQRRQDHAAQHRTPAPPRSAAAAAAPPLAPENAAAAARGHRDEAGGQQPRWLHAALRQPPGAEVADHV